MRKLPVNWLELIWTSDLESSSKYICAYLRTYMNAKNAMAWPSMARITKDTSLTKNTVIKHIKKIEAAGWLEVDRSKGGHSQTTNHYKIAIPKDILEEIAADLTGVQPVNPSGATTALVGVQSLNTNKQRNKQSNKQVILQERISNDNFNSASKYWASKSVVLDADDEWFRFCAHHQSKATKITNYDAAWRTWYCNAAEWRGKPANQPSKTRSITLKESLTDTSWAE